MKPAHWAALAIVMLVALGMRLYRIGAETIWFDEAITYMGLHEANPMDFFHHEATRDPKSVPFYYACAYVWYRLGFTSVTGMRMLSVSAGMGVVAGLYFFGRRFFGHIGGLTAALCVACAKLHVYEAQEIRNYTFTLAAALFTMFAFHKAAVENDKRWWPVNVAANVLLSYTHFLAMILLFAQGVYFLVTRPRQIKGIALWTFAHAPFLALIPLWQKAITTADFEHETNWIPGSYKLRAFETYYYVFAGSKLDAPDFIRALPFGTVPIHHTLGCAMLLAGASFAAWSAWVWLKGFESLPGFKPANALFLLVWLFVPPAALYMIGKIQPVFLERYVLYSSLALYLCVGGAVAALPWRSAQYGAFALLALAFAGNTVDMIRPLRYDIGAAGAVLRDEYAPGEHVYSWHEDIQIPLHFYGGVPENMLVGADDFAERAVAEAESGKRSWICFFEVPHRFDHGDVEAAIERHPGISMTRWIYGGRWNMYLYRLDLGRGEEHLG